MATQTLAISFIQPAATASIIDMDAIDGDPGIRLARAQSSHSKRGQYLASMFGKPTLIAEGVNTNDTTPAALELMDLTDLGVTFPTGTFRQIRWRHFLQSDNDQFYVEYERWVAGAATPVLLGTRRVVHAHGVVATANVAYGVCHAAANYDSSDTAIVTDVGTSDVSVSSTAGSSIGNISTNTATLTHPVARVAGKRVLGINCSSDVAPAPESLLASVFPVNTTTMSIFTADTATPSADGFDDDGRLEVSFFILPPGDADLVMNSTHVELQVTGGASDEARPRRGGGGEWPPPRPPTGWTCLSVPPCWCRSRALDC